jgi:hypothetical protein
MKTRVLALLLGLSLLARPTPSALGTLVAIDEVKPGMVGEGFTVFEGTRRESFKVHVLGVWQNVAGPKRNLVLARLEGGPLAATGVIAGMSGSPVYLNGRLLGAVAFSLGSFSREPIAGITPISEMIEATEVSAARPPVQRAAIPLPLSHDVMVSALRDALPRARPFAERAGDVRTLSGTGIDPLALSLRPVATPLGLAGFSGEARELLMRVFSEAGFAPVAVGTMAAPTPTAPSEPLQPGDAVGVSLVSGDLALGATGTVTHVDGSRVYAFGHPLFSLGPVQFPMTRSYVHTVLPSLLSSVKIASLGPVVGTVSQDRATALAGTLGPSPPMVPIRISLESDRGTSHTFSLQVADDQTYTPLLAYVSLLSVLQSYERMSGAATLTVTGETRVKGRGRVALEDLFTGDAPSVNAAAYVVTPLNLLLRNDRAPVEIEGVDVTIRSSEQQRRATLERAWIDAVRVRPGQSVDLKVVTRGYRGEETLRTVPIEIPANARGTLSLLVSDGSRLAQWEQREWRQTVDTQSVDQLIRVFNSSRKNNRLYVRLIRPAPGAVVDGETLPALPPSVLAVLEADKSGGSFSSLRNAIVGAWEFPTDHAVVGSRLLTIDVGGT